jgi:UDPglucose 6-dehydrogenase
VVNKSTVPVGTADRVRQVIGEALTERGRKIDFDVVSNPEFLKEGQAVGDFMRPDRIIVGSDDEAAADLIAEAYAPLNRNHDRVMRMSTRSAELTKYAANAMLATRISFMNELANLSEAVGADIEEIRQGIGSDSRIGFDFLYAGCGFGGSCFPKDVRALGHTTREALGRPFRILEAVASVNDAQKRLLFDKASRYFDGALQGKRIGVWGLSFKPNTDDMREATSRVLIEALVGAGAHVAAYDPAAMEQARRCFAGLEGVELVESPQQALEDTDALIIVTEWREFRAQDFGRLKPLMRRPVIFDGRNLYEPGRMAQLGFHYEGIGRLGSVRNGNRNGNGPAIP